MSRVEYLRLLRADGARIGELADGDPAAPVPACPGWGLGDLVAHTGQVHRMVAEILEVGTAPTAFPDPPAPERVADWYRSGLETLVARLEASDPETACWNWSLGNQKAGFWVRRMAHETAVHRWDAESAMGSPAPVAAALAADGIDEWFDVHVRSDLGNPSVDPSGCTGSLHVHCTDVEGEWWAQVADRDLELDRSHRKGDAVIRGSASDILLVLWGRRPLESHEIFGGSDIVGSWLALPRI